MSMMLIALLAVLLPALQTETAQTATMQSDVDRLVRAAEGVSVTCCCTFQRLRSRSACGSSESRTISSRTTALPWRATMATSGRDGGGCDGHVPARCGLTGVRPSRQRPTHCPLKVLVIAAYRTVTKNTWDGHAPRDRAVRVHVDLVVPGRHPADGEAVAAVR
jgi:hypothetical protein